ncbi:MAG: hypothetical protein ACTSUE_19420 [Promethearchaeota archaeon]
MAGTGIRHGAAVFSTVLFSTLLISGVIFVASSSMEGVGSPEGGMGGMGGINHSGSFNTKIFIDSISNSSPAQGDIFSVYGWVTVANLSSGTYDPWENVSVALTMNGSFTWENASASSIVNTTTDSNGNFTLNYDIPFNHTVGRWNASVGLSPIPAYNYTHNQNVTAIHQINVTANVQIIYNGILPDAIWPNENFLVLGQLLTEGGMPVQGQTVWSNFSSNYYPSNPSGATGLFNISVPGIPSNMTFDLVFPATTFYNNASLPGLSLVYLDNASHAFSGQVLTHDISNPVKVGTQLVIQGAFTYNPGDVGGGDGFVKDQSVQIYWRTNDSIEYLIGTVNTSSTGAYSFVEIVNDSQFIDEALFYGSNIPTQVRLRVVLDTVPGIEFMHYLFIRPDLNVTLHPSMQYAIFEQDDMIIDGTINPIVAGLPVAVDLHYSNGTTFNYNSSVHDPALGLMETLANGRFLFSIQGSRIQPNLDNVTVIVNPGMTAGHGRAIKIIMVDFISTVDFTAGLSISNSSQAIDGTNKIVHGTPVSGSGDPIRNHAIYVVYDQGSGPVLLQGFTGVDGSFVFSIPVNGGAGQVLSISLFMNTSTGTNFVSASYGLTIVEPFNYSSLLWILVPAIGVLILLGYVYIQLKKKKEIIQTRSLLQQKLELIRELVRVGKLREAIAYCYHLFKEIAVKTFDIEDSPESETIREFIMSLMTEKGVDPLLSFDFMNRVTEGLYSHHPIGKENVSETVRLFGKLYRVVTNDHSENISL